MKFLALSLTFLIWSCRSNNADPYGYEAEQERITKEAQAIKIEAQNEFANQWTKISKTNPAYLREVREIKTEFEAYKFIQKYHKDVCDFYTRKFMQHFDHTMATASFMDETTRPMWASRRETMMDTIPSMLARDVLRILESARSK